ncbi:MAG: hypothetical protein PHU34_09345 [Candidatus Methanoperedens sp.]|nr:hypothetical protein [Candidatus Methanoperedens sp.]
MKILLSERKYRIPLGSHESRRRYLEKVIAQLNNELTEPDLSPVDKSRFYNSLLNAIKLAHEFEYDMKLQELDGRLKVIENRLP